MKIIDQKETQKTPKKQRQTKTREQGGTEAIVKGWELNDFAVHLS